MANKVTANGTAGMIQQGENNLWQYDLFHYFLNNWHAVRYVEDKMEDVCKYPYSSGHILAVLKLSGPFTVYREEKSNHYDNLLP